MKPGGKTADFIRSVGILEFWVRERWEGIQLMTGGRGKLAVDTERLAVCYVYAKLGLKTAACCVEQYDKH